MVAGCLRIDGAPATAEDLARQALSNYGAYTALQVTEGGARGLDLHIERLESAAVELFGAGAGGDRLRALMREAVQGHGDCWLRVSLFAREISARSPDWRGRPRVMTAVLPSPPPLGPKLRLAVQPYQRECPHLKHVSTFGLIRARRLAREAGRDDALFIGTDGRVSEGALWNIGFLSGSTVVWPDAPMLPGVGQALLRRGLNEVGLTEQVRRVHLDDLAGFDGAFICNSATPAADVASIGDRVYASAPEMMERLAAAWASNPIQPI